MDTKEVYNEIRAMIKPHLGKMPQSTFSNTMGAIIAGTCKPKTMQKFFAKFGYEQNEVIWKKR